MNSDFSALGKPHILVVDDDDRLRDLLRRFLVENGFIVSTAGNTDETRRILKILSFDLMVLDVMMPGQTGLEFVRELREEKTLYLRNLPVLLLTALGESEDRIKGFECGGDDYLSKPFEPKELLLRINAILKRSVPAKTKTLTLQLGRWTYDPQRDELTNQEETLRLTDMEAGLMRALAADAGSVVSRESLAETGKTNINDRTIDVQVTRLRRKIEGDTKNPRYLVTVRGEGYMLLPDMD